MNRLGAGDTFKGIKSKESRLESNKVQRLPDSIRPAMFVLEVLAMLFALDGSADPMRVVRRDPDAIDYKGNGCQRIVEALLDGWEETIGHLQVKAVCKRVGIDIHAARHRKIRIWSGFVLMGFHPFEADFE
jgi:hypothetical protein